MIAVVGAMDSEVAAVGGRLTNREAVPVEGCAAWRGHYGDKVVLVCRTGIGRRAETATRTLIDRYRPAALISIGVAGALNPRYAVGELIICEIIATLGGETPVRSDEKLVRLARGTAEVEGLPVWLGRSLTVDEVVGEPASKEALHRERRVDLVEMESYWIGAAAMETETPFLTVRTVLDGPNDRLSPLPGVVSPDGSRRTLRVIPHVLRQPALVPGLLSLARAERRALAALNRFLGAFLPSLEVSPAASMSRSGK